MPNEMIDPRPWASISAPRRTTARTAAQGTRSTRPRPAPRATPRRLRVGDVALHPQRQRLQSLHEQEGVEGRDGGPDVTHPLHPGLEMEMPGSRAPASTGVRGSDGSGSVNIGMPTRSPVECPPVDDHTADRGAVTAQELRGRVDDDVGSPAERLAEVGRRHGVVDDQRDPLAVRHPGDPLDVEDRVPRVGQCLAEERAVLGRIAARHSSRSSGSSTKVTSTPSLGIV